MSLWQRRLAMKQSWPLNILTIAVVALLLPIVMIFGMRSSCQESKMATFAKKRFAELCYKKWSDIGKCEQHTKKHHKRCFGRTYFPKGHKRTGPSPELFTERRYHICMLLGPKGYYGYLRAYNKAQSEERHRPAFRRKYKDILPKMPWTFKGG